MHIAKMTRGTIAERLKIARARRFRNPAEAARAMGVPEPTYYGHENGHRIPERDTVLKYAAFFHVPVDWLLTGKGSVMGSTHVPVVGYIGAGAEIIPMDDFAQGDGLELVPAPMGVDTPCVAARIRGDSMYPFKSGWIVFWSEHPHGITEDCLGKLCVVKLLDGRMLLKELHRGSVPGSFNLLSWNAPPLLDAAVEWATRVLSIVTT